MRHPMARGTSLNSDEIDAYGFLRDLMLQAIEPHGKKKAPALFSGKCLYGTSVRYAGAVLYFKKDGNAVFFCYNVDFSSFGSYEIGFRNFIAMLLEITYGYKLALIADGSIG